MTPVQEATKTWHWHCTRARSQRARLTGSLCNAPCPSCPWLSPCVFLCLKEGIHVPGELVENWRAVRTMWLSDAQAAGRAMSCRCL